MKDKWCPICEQGELEEKQVRIAQDVPERGVVIFEKVPASVCKVCGHQWVSQAVMKELEKLVDGGEPNDMQQVPVFSL